MSPIDFTVFVIFSLWDYYIPAAGGKVLDYFGILILALSLLPRLALGDWRPLGITPGHFVFLLTLSPLIALGAARGNILTAAAFLVGCLFVYSIFFRKEIDYHLVYRQIGWLIVFNLIAFYIQYVTFWVSGYLINYHSWIGAADPRVLVSDIIRAGGFYQEPNGFCLTLLMLTAVRLFCPKTGHDYLFPVCIVTLVISESLWGIAAAPLLILCRMYLSERKTRGIPILVPAVASALALAALFVDWPLVLEFVFSPLTIARLMDVTADSSAQERFTGTGGFALDFRFLVGHGPSTIDFQSYLGVNGLSFYVYGFGLIGFLLFLFFVFSISNGNALVKIALVVLAMSTYPLFTYAFWWFWLALLAKANAEDFARAGQRYAIASARHVPA